MMLIDIFLTFFSGTITVHALNFYRASVCPYMHTHRGITSFLNPAARYKIPRGIHSAGKLNVRGWNFFCQYALYVEYSTR